MNKMRAFFLLACVTLLSDGARAYTQDNIEAPISFPESVDAHDALGSAYMNAGNYESAIRSFTRSLELYPINSGAFDMLNMALAQQESTSNP
jgi:tetratricopeptide (TPR) repeat protein